MGSQKTEENIQTLQTNSLGQNKLMSAVLAVENGWEEEPGSYWQVLSYQTKSMSSVKSKKKTPKTTR